MHKSKPSRREEKNENTIVKILIGSFAGTLIFFLLTFLFAYAVLKAGLDSGMYLPALMVFGALSAFINGFAAVRPIKRSGAPLGALSGAMEAFICAVVIFFANGANAGKGLLILAAAIIVASAVGGVVAANLRIRKKY